jgi:hypothetical protein
MEWIYFADQKPPSFTNIIYEYKVLSNSEKMQSMGWVDSGAEEDLSIFDMRGFSVYADDEDYELIAWLLIPTRTCPDCKANFSEVDGHYNRRLGPKAEE